MDCTIVTNTNNDDEAYSLIKAFGFPIKDRKKSVKLEEAPVEGAPPEETPVEETSTEEAPAEEASAEE